MVFGMGISAVNNANGDASEPETVRTHMTQLSWDLSSHEERGRKSKRYLSGDSDGADIPHDVKRRLRDKRLLGKVSLVVLLVSVAFIFLA